MQLATVLKYIWAAPGTVLGVCSACVASILGAKFALVQGILEVSLLPRYAVLHRAMSSFPIAAITFGHVVVARSEQDQVVLREHERVHVTQYEKWGVFFLLAYPLESLLQLLLGRRPYHDNRFEVAARAAIQVNAQQSTVVGEA
jgi:hypothetical protein